MTGIRSFAALVLVASVSLMAFNGARAQDRIVAAGGADLTGMNAVKFFYDKVNDPKLVSLCLAGGGEG